MQNTIQVVVDALYTYPVKSCAPRMVNRLDFDDDGLLVGDREWVIVDGQASVVWQGSHPRLALVRPELADGVLSLRNADGDRQELRPGRDCSPCKVQIWNDATKQNDVYDATDEGGAMADFLWRTLGDKLRLVRLGRDALRREGVNRVHLVSRESFDEFLATLALTGHPPVGLERFRPNIVISGEGAAPLLPFLEEQFSTLEWSDGMGPASLVVHGPCARCVVPNVDPDSGRIDDRVLQTVGGMSAQRFPGGPTHFGMYARSGRAASLVQGATLSASLTF